MGATIWFLFLAVAVSGGCGMALEMVASRLMVPFYGDSHLIWANIIILVLAALTLGYFVGGKLADRWPYRRYLALGIAFSAILTAIIPLLGVPLLNAITTGFPQNQAGFILGSLLAVAVLFAVPTLLLGCVSPYAVRLALADIKRAGKVTGSLYAVSTVGSMIGTFLPVLWLLPSYGVRATIAIIAAVLLLTALLGIFLPAASQNNAAIK